MRFIVMVMPNPDSQLRLQGEADTMLGAVQALLTTVTEYGSPAMLKRLRVELSQLHGKLLHADFGELVPSDLNTDL